MRTGKALRSTSGDALLLTAIKLVTIVLGIANTRLLSEHLSVHDYGTYSQILLIVSLVTSVTVLGMMDGVNYYHGSVHDPHRRETYIATIFTLQCMVSACAGGIVMLLSRPISKHFQNPDVGKLLIFAAALPLLQNLMGMLQVLLVSVGKARMLAVRNLAVSLLRLGAVILLVTVVKNVAVILLATLLLDVAQVAFFGLILRKNHCTIRLFRTDFRLARQIFRYCVPMGIFTAVNALTRDCDKYLISLMTDTETLAVYANASKALPFDILMASFFTVLIPEITRGIAAEEYEKTTRLYRTFLEIAYISAGIPCGAALAAAPQLIQLLYSQKYLGGLTVFCIYIIVDLMRFTNLTLVLSASGKTKLLMILGIGALGLNMVLNVVLFQLIGIAGPALATLLTTIVLGICILTSGARVLRSRVSELFDGKYLSVFTLELAGAVWVFSRFRDWLAERNVHYFVILMIVGGGCGMCMLLLHGKRLLKTLKQINTFTAKN